MRLPITGSLAFDGESGKWKSSGTPVDVARCWLIWIALRITMGSRELQDGIPSGLPICGEVKSRTNHQSDVRRQP
jgi:hypothetical protein